MTDTNMDKFYAEFAKLHIESMTTKELQTRLTEVHDFLTEVTKAAKVPNTNTVEIFYVMERLTDILIGDLSE